MKGKGQVEGLAFLRNFCSMLTNEIACVIDVTPSHWSIFSKKIAKKLTPPLTPFSSSKISDSVLLRGKRSANKYTSIIPSLTPGCCIYICTTMLTSTNYFSVKILSKLYFDRLLFHHATARS